MFGSSSTTRMRCCSVGESVIAHEVSTGFPGTCCELPGSPRGRDSDAAGRAVRAAGAVAAVAVVAAGEAVVGDPLLLGGDRGGLAVRPYGPARRRDARERERERR